MVSDSSDILGQQTMPVLKGDRTSAFPFSVFQLVVIVLVLVAIYVVGNRLRKSILLWREESYKLATRRRHGIPDSDLRPFNVAYSEAMTRARDEDKRRHVPPAQFRPQQQLRQRDGHIEDAEQNHQALHRPQAVSRSTAVPLPGAYYTPAPDNHSQPMVGRSSNIASNNAYSRPSVSYPIINGVSKPLSRQPAFTHVPSTWPEHDVRKRALDGNDDEHEFKKTRVEGGEMLDGDDEPVYEENFQSKHKRGSKRGIQEEDEDDDYSDQDMENKKTRGKRARKVSLANSASNADHYMDVDEEEEDEIMELRSSYRGKKRDRAEAGSTFGGDDDESEHELDSSKIRRRHRKRRTVAKRKSEASYIRGKRRERNGDLDNSDLPSEDASSPEKVSGHRRRGRHSLHNDEDNLARSDVSMGDSTISTRSKVRSIGDEWESNGVKYKIGPNGQRLRQTLVKKARHKFVMPQDSQHPDREANLQVCVECWLTEEEYRDAKAEHILAWQDSPKKSEDVEKLTVDVSQEKVRFPQGTSGKSLLWSTSTSTTPTLSPSSYSPAAALPTSPFLNSQAPTTRRISSSSRTISLTSSYNVSPKFTDSTNGPLHPTHKVFSKWEKQELEAQAMTKIRELNRRKEQEKMGSEQKERDLKAKLEASKASSVPSISVIPPDASKPASASTAPSTGSSSMPNLFGAPAPATSTTAPSTTSTSTQESPATNLFGKPAQPSSGPPSAPSKGPFSFAPAPSASTNTAASDAPKPSFGFGATAPTISSASDTSKPSSGSFSFPPAAGSSTNNAPKSAFSFPPSAPTNASSTNTDKPLFTFPASTPAAPASQDKSESAGASIFSRIGPPQATSSETKPASSTPAAPAPAPMFSFSKPAPVASGSTTNSADNASGLKFSFPASKDATPAAATSAFGTNAAATSSAFPSTSSSTGASSSAPSTDKVGGDKPIFAFNGASSGASNPFGSTGTTSTNSFGSTGTTSTNPFGSTTATPAPAAPKFSFGGSAFGATQAPSSSKESDKPAFGTGASNPTSAFGPSSSAFGSSSLASAFGTPANGEKKEAPKSAFGSTTFGSAPSVFGASNTTAPSAFGSATNNKPTDAPKFNTTTTSAFNPPSNGASTFGSNANPFGSKPPAPTNTTSNPFGSAAGGAAKTGETNKPLFSFAPTTNGTSTPGSKATPSFSFGPPASTTPSSTPAPANTTTPAGAPAAGAFSFNFGQGSTTPAASPFGAPPSVFAQANGGSSTTSAFSFTPQK